MNQRLGPYIGVNKEEQRMDYNTENLIYLTLGEYKATSEEKKLKRKACVNCKAFNDRYLGPQRDSWGRSCIFCVCINCKLVYRDHENYLHFTPEDRELETEREKIIRLEGLRIYNLRKHRRSIKALLTFLYNRILPNDLVRMTKGFLY